MPLRDRLRSSDEQVRLSALDLHRQHPGVLFICRADVLAMLDAVPKQTCPRRDLEAFTS